MPRLKHEYIKQHLSTIGLELLSEYQQTHFPMIVKCICGNIFYPRYNNIKYGKTKNCGHCNDPKIGDVFGNLTIIEVYPSVGGSCSVKCKCDCGKECGPYIASYVVTNHIVNCGNCKLKRNGVYTSLLALELHDIVERITNLKWTHNYHIKNIGYIDIANPELNIAIEYDGYYYHKIVIGDRAKHDLDKYNKILSIGWKLLNIKSGGRDLPDLNSINEALDRLQKDTQQVDIIMDSWYKRKSTELRKYEVNEHSQKSTA